MIIRHTRFGRKVMRLIFYLPKFLFFSNINVIPLHTGGDAVLIFGSGTGSLELVWSSAKSHRGQVNRRTGEQQECILR